MYGWQIPPPKKPSKSKADFARERREKVASLIEQGLLKSERIKQRAGVHRLQIAPGNSPSGVTPIAIARKTHDLLVRATNGERHTT